jgi:hypothetical protein
MQALAAAHTRCASDFTAAPALPKSSRDSATELTCVSGLNAVFQALKPDGSTDEVAGISSVCGKLLWDFRASNLLLSEA